MRGRLLVHPVFTGTVALLAVNDHVLKAWFPGWWTGKLSDFAGVFLLGVVLGLLIGRIRPSLVAAGLSFSAIKLSSQAASLVAPLLGGLTRQDPSDLLALAALWPAYLFLTCAEVPRGSTSLRSALTLTAAGVMLLSVTATSCLPPHVLDAFIVEEDGRVFAHIPRDAEGGDVRWAVSDDGGTTWVEASLPSSAEVMRRQEACAQEVGCFRVIEGRRVEHEEQDGSWRAAFAFSSEEVRRLDLRNRDCGEVDPREDGFRTLATVERGDGAHVVVAMGTQGVLHRDPQGTWARRAVLDLQPDPLYGPSWLFRLALAPLVLGLLSLVFLIAGIVQRRGRDGRVAFAISIAGAAFLLILVAMLAFFGVDYAILGPVIASLALVLFVVSLVLYIRRPGSGSRGASTSGI